MGRQSSRLYYQGKDHKDIYFQGHYHDAMYIGNQLVWEKLKDDELTALWSDEIYADAIHRSVQDVFMTNDGSIYFYISVEEGASSTGVYYIDAWYCDGNVIPDDRAGQVSKSFSGNNFGISENSGRFLLGDQNAFQTGKINDYSEGSGYVNNYILIRETLSTPDIGTPRRDTFLAFLDIRSKEIVPLGGIVVNGILSNPDSRGLRENRERNCTSGYISDPIQYFNGTLYANVGIYIEDSSYGHYSQSQSMGFCSTRDGINWTSCDTQIGKGSVYNNILFCDDGRAYNTSLQEVSYTKKPAFYYNGYYYAEDLEDNFILRSADLTGWEKYKKIPGNYSAQHPLKLMAYWKERGWIIFSREGYAGLSKYKGYL